MLRIFLMLLLCFINQTKQTSKESINHPNHNNQALTKNNNKNQAKTDKEHLSCNGWCLDNTMKKVKSKLLREIYAVVTKTQVDREAQKLRYNSLMSEIQENQYISLRSTPGTFADKSVYSDKDRASPRSILLRRDIVKVPSEFFYPFTRNALKMAIKGSGFLYLPYEEKNTVLTKKEKEISKNVYPSKRLFTNRYFESNPYLCNKILTQKTRKAKIEPDEDIYSEGGSNESIDWLESRKNVDDNEAPEVATIHKFVLGSDKRSRLATNNSEAVRELLGVQDEERTLAKPYNEVEDIVAGMKIRSKHPTMFVIGATDKAQADVQSWINQKSRSKPLQADSGFLIKAEARQNSINVLLKSLLVNYQYRCALNCRRKEKD
ncbi:hypothetical protein ILUMI_04509 [Ignelater luminosus]|uniref:Uncharacterized protein n=1 Tax=Ignelater luminosus TaxID=2038154 RepID=A0A8K0GJJ4_IGNLU|nr:hypothetical protein ILUMI_04509 [Ignelater luminosus]